MRRILHVDMDAFFASVEQHDFPQYRGRPLIVGGSAQHRGVVAAASYEARKFGIRSAMPTAQAFKLCPDVIRVDIRRDRYVEVSRQIHDIFASYTERIEPLSLDESYLDLSDYCIEHGCRLREVALDIKQRIRDTTGLTASAGGGPNKLVAKIASDIDKPDGLVVVPPERVQAFLAPLPVERLWGIGPVTAKRFHDVGIHTIGELAQGDPSYRAMCLGQDDRPVEPWHDPRSISSEETFSRDTRSIELVAQELRAQAAEVARRLVKRELLARTVTLKVRYSDFTTVTRRRTLSDVVQSEEPLFEHALDLLQTRTEFPRRALRLVGLGASGLLSNTATRQLTLALE